MATNINDFLTVQQAAKVLKVTGGRVRCFIRDERLKAVQIATKSYLIPRKELEKFKQIDRPKKGGRPKKAG